KKKICEFNGQNQVEAIRYRIWICMRLNSEKSVSTTILRLSRTVRRMISFRRAYGGCYIIWDTIRCTSWSEAMIGGLLKAIVSQMRYQSLRKKNAYRNTNKKRVAIRIRSNNNQRVS